MPDYNKLVKQAIKGDYDAFEQLVEHHKDKVYSTCLFLLGSVPESLEAAEQIFVIVYRSLREAEEKSVSEWIYRLAESHASNLRNELVRRGFAQPQNQAVTLKTSDEITAPPGFVAAVRERLLLDAEVALREASRRRLRFVTAGIAAASVSIMAAWAAYQYIFWVSEPIQSIAVQAPSTPTPPAAEVPPTPAPTAPPAPLSSPLPPEPLLAKQEPKTEAIPEIAISNPRHDNSSPEEIFNKVFPPLKSPPTRDGSRWTVELTDNQFWSLHSLLKSSYSKVRVPESAIPQDQSRAKIRLKFMQAGSVQHKAEPIRKQAQKETEVRSRLPAEDLLKDE